LKHEDSAAWRDIANPVSEDLVALIVVAMLTGCTIIVLLVGSSPVL
jgi:hypothetical protein